MSEDTKYYIVEKNTAKRLQEMVNDMLGQGWGVYGSPFVSVEYDPREDHAPVTMFYQALVRR